MKISDQDRDLAIRTMIGEAADQPDSGQAGVAHVILNRLNAKKFGNSVRDIVLAPKQFEPWQTRADELKKIDVNSRSYRRAADIFDGVASGDMLDPTGGATHFLQPEIVKARRGGTLPAWAQGDGVRIGDHVFYGQPATPRENPGQRAIGQAMANAPKPDKVETISTQALPFQPGDVFKSFGVGAADKAEPATAPTTPAATAAAPAFKPGSVFDQFGIGAAKPDAEIKDVRGQTAVERSTQERAMVPSPETFKGLPPAGPQSTVMSAIEKIDPSLAAGLKNGQVAEMATSPLRVPGNIWQRGTEAVDLAKSGMSDIANRQYGPSFPSADPRTWGAGGLLKTAGGVLGVPFAPLTGTTKTIGEEFTKATGNPDAGNKLESILNLGVPGTKGAAGIKAALPANRAVETLVNAIGEKNLPAFVKRAEQNPTLTPMDVSQPVLELTQGIAANPKAPRAVNALRDVVDARSAAEKGSVLSGAAEMGGLPTLGSPLAALEKIKGQAHEVGQKIIQPALDKAGPVDTTRVVNLVDQAMQREVAAQRTQAAAMKAAHVGEDGPFNPSMQVTGTGLQNRLAHLKNDLVAGDKQVSDAGRLHEIQAELRAEAQSALNSGDGLTRQYGHQLMKFRNEMVNAIDKGAPGYKEALAKYRDAHSVHEWWERGQNFMRNSKDIATDSAEAWARDWAKASREERLAGAAGTLGELQRMVRTMKTAGSVEGIPQIMETSDKLRIMFGKEKADKFLQWVKDEGAKRNVNNKLFEGSQTELRKFGAEALKIREIGGAAHGAAAEASFWPLAGIALEMGGSVPGASLAGFGMGAARMGGHVVKTTMQKIGRRADIAHNEAFAKLASTPLGENMPLMQLLKQRASPNAIGPRNKLVDLLSKTGTLALPP